MLSSVFTDVVVYHIYLSRRKKDGRLCRRKGEDHGQKEEINNDNYYSFFHAPPSVSSPRSSSCLLVSLLPRLISFLVNHRGRFFILHQRPRPIHALRRRHVDWGLQLLYRLCVQRPRRQHVTVVVNVICIFVEGGLVASLYTYRYTRRSGTKKGSSDQLVHTISHSYLL